MREVGKSHFAEFVRDFTVPPSDETINYDLEDYSIFDDTFENKSEESLDFQLGKSKIPKLTKKDRKFLRTLERDSKLRREDINRAVNLDPKLKAFYTKGYKG